MNLTMVPKWALLTLQSVHYSMHHSMSQNTGAIQQSFGPMTDFVIKSERTLQNVYQKSFPSIKTSVTAVENITPHSFKPVTAFLINSERKLYDAYQRVPSPVKTAVVVGGVTLAAPYIVPLVIHPLGWTATGVKAGTISSAWQSTLGGIIAKNSLFSLLQKTAMNACIGIDLKIPMAVFLIFNGETTNTWIRSFLQDNKKVETIEGIAVDR